MFGFTHVLLSRARRRAPATARPPASQGPPPGFNWEWALSFDPPIVVRCARGRSLLMRCYRKMRCPLLPACAGRLAMRKPLGMRTNSWHERNLLA